MRRVLLVTLVLLTAGCGASAADAFRADGFYHPDYAYRVGSRDGTRRRLMPQDWRLDNFVLDEGEVEGRKDGPDYVYTAEFDVGGDGDVDARAELYLYDLRFEHTRHDGVVWLRTFPYAREDRQKELGILARKHLAAVAGVGVSVPVFENVAEGVDDLRVEQRRYGTRVLESVTAHVGRARAFRVTFDVFNLDQMEVDPDTPARRVRIYFIRPPFNWEYPDGATRGGASRGRWPALMTFGYSNHADQFDEGLPAFEELVGRLGFERGGYESGVRILEYIQSWEDRGGGEVDDAPDAEPEWNEDGPVATPEIEGDEEPVAGPQPEEAESPDGPPAQPPAEEEHEQGPSHDASQLGDPSTDAD